MTGPVNIRDLPAGTRITLVDGGEAEITDNPGDGVWVFVRHLRSPRDAALVGQEDMIFAQDVIAVRAN